MRCSILSQPSTRYREIQTLAPAIQYPVTCCFMDQAGPYVTDMKRHRNSQMAAFLYVKRKTMNKSKNLRRQRAGINTQVQALTAGENERRR